MVYPENSLLLCLMLLKGFGGSSAYNVQSSALCLQTLHQYNHKGLTYLIPANVTFPWSLKYYSVGNLFNLMFMMLRLVVIVICLQHSQSPGAHRICRTPNTSRVVPVPVGFGVFLQICFKENLDRKGTLKKYLGLCIISRKKNIFG